MTQQRVRTGAGDGAGGSTAEAEGLQQQGLVGAECCAVCWEERRVRCGAALHAGHDQASLTCRGLPACAPGRAGLAAHHHAGCCSRPPPAARLVQQAAGQSAQGRAPPPCVPGPLLAPWGVVGGVAPSSSCRAPSVPWAAGPHHPHEGASQPSCRHSHPDLQQQQQNFHYGLTTCSSHWLQQGSVRHTQAASAVHTVL